VAVGVTVLVLVLGTVDELLILNLKETEMKNETLKLLVSLIEQDDVNSGSCKPHPFVVGQNYFFRLVTHYLTGKIKEIHGDFIALEDAAWISDTGRFSDALKSGEFEEVEPIFNPHGINMTAIVDYDVWPHALPRERK
jgi:hypothetical protein